MLEKQIMETKQMLRYMEYISNKTTSSTEDLKTGASGKEIVGIIAVNEGGVFNPTAEEGLQAAVSPAGDNRGHEHFEASGMEIVDATVLKVGVVLSPSAEEDLQPSVLFAGVNRVSPCPNKEEVACDWLNTATTTFSTIRVIL